MEKGQGNGSYDAELWAGCGPLGSLELIRISAPLGEPRDPLISGSFSFVSSRQHVQSCQAASLAFRRNYQSLDRNPITTKNIPVLPSRRKCQLIKASESVIELIKERLRVFSQRSVYF